MMTCVLIRKGKAHRDIEKEEGPCEDRGRD